MLDYPTTAPSAAPAAKLGSSANPARPLETLGMAVSRIESVNNRLSGFVGRFNATGGDGACPPEPGCYAAVLQRLFVAIDDLERRTTDIEDIG